MDLVTKNYTNNLYYRLTSRDVSGFFRLQINKCIGQAFKKTSGWNSANSVLV